MGSSLLVVAYATGWASHARQVKGDDPDEKGYSGPPGWGLGMRLTTSTCKKKILLRNLKRRPRPTQGCRADDDGVKLVTTCFGLSSGHHQVTT